MEGLNGSSPGQGHNGLAEQDAYLTFCNELDEAEADHAACLAACKEPKKRIKDIRKRIDAAIGLVAFDRAREDSKKPSATREREHEQYLKNMAWERKPVGSQAKFSFEGPLEYSVAELKRVDGEGHEAGRQGDRADSNPYNAGTEAYARWHTAWLRGQEEKVRAKIKEPKPTRAAKSAKSAEPKRRGRTPGSGKKQREAAAAAAATGGAPGNAAEGDKL